MCRYTSFCGQGLTGKGRAMHFTMRIMHVTDKGVDKLKTDLYDKYGIG